MRENVPKGLPQGLVPVPVSPPPAMRGSLGVISLPLYLVPSNGFQATGPGRSLRASPHAGMLMGWAEVIGAGTWVVEDAGSGLFHFGALGDRPHPGRGVTSLKLVAGALGCFSVPLPLLCVLAELGRAQGGGLGGGGSRIWQVPAPTSERLGAYCWLPWQPQLWAFLIWILVCLFISLSQCTRGSLLPCRQPLSACM